MFSCSNDRYAYRRDNNGCCRQSSNTVEIFVLCGYPDFVHTNVSLKVQISPADPSGECVQADEVLQPETHRGWLHLACHLPSVAFQFKFNFLGINQMKLHTAAVRPVPPLEQQSSLADSSCLGCVCSALLLAKVQWPKSVAVCETCTSAMLFFKNFKTLPWC